MPLDLRPDDVSVFILSMLFSDHQADHSFHRSYRPDRRVHCSLELTTGDGGGWEMSEVDKGDNCKAEFR